jgi:hypothetical protein
MAIDQKFEIKEELRWVYVLVRNNTEWGEYKTKEEAETAMENIKINMSIRPSK